MAKKSALFIVAVLAPATVFAQAWVPRAGDGTVAFVYQNQLVRDHLVADGSRLDVGHIVTDSLLLDFTYGITDKLALNINVPYIASAYHGHNPHPGSTLDDGRVHGTLQDFRADIRYNVMRRGIVLTPFVDVIVPSHRYEYFGHAAPGRRLAEVQLGANIGHVITRGLPGAFVQTRVSYGFSQQPLGRYHDRTNADGELGYFVNPRFRVFGLLATQYTFGGVPLTSNFSQVLTADEFHHHDQISRSDLLDMGAGAQVQLTRRIDIVGSYATTITGRSGHALGRGITIGLSWGFGHSFDGGTRIAGMDAPARLPKCLCEKGTPTP
jgi:hypothetical protein